MKLKHSKIHLKNYRRKLRSNATPAERYLWSHLKNRKLDGIRFQRQHSINNYIVDFYCAAHQLVIELDGQYHDETNQSESDNQRDAYLKKNGIKVLRYENRYVFEQLDHVLNNIKNHCQVSTLL